MKGLGKQLLVTLVDSAGALRARYVLMSGRRVLSKGECAPGDLPHAGEARATFFSRGSYFDRAEVEARNMRTLPFQARRVIEAALAFNEPFKVRYAATETNAGLQRLDLAAAPDVDIRAAMELLPLQTVPFTRLTLAENAIAALVALETDEPAAVLWMRDNVLVGLLVENGVVLSRSMDRPMPGAEDDLNARLERVQHAVEVAARRLFQSRDVTLTLMMGELLSLRVPGSDAPSRSLENRMTKRFSGGENEVLLWPELYGLSAVPACYSLLESNYQEEAQASRYASTLGLALSLLGVVGLIAASVLYFNLRVTQETFQTRNAKLEAEYASVRQKLPSPEQLAAMEQRLRMQAGLTDFRVDDFLSWVSQVTPEGALVRALSVTKAAAPAGQPAAGGLVMTIEWEVSGDYASVEQLTSGLLISLGERTTLSNNRLDYKPGQNARFTTVLAPLPNTFR
ncbi:MAG: hypothetical protein U1C96_12475 [Gallionella sp.]|nr:hypothetical protein [Gallionella sp.]